MDKSEHPTVTDRRAVREAPGPHFRRVATVWSGLLGVPVTAEQVVLCMIGLKLAREAGMHDPDNITDAEGYLSLLPEVRSALIPEEQSSCPKSLPSNQDELRASKSPRT